MILGYARVSTLEQAVANKTSLQEQERAINAYAQSQGVGKYDVQIYSDAGVSGGSKMLSRPGGQQLLEAVTAGDTVVASKMDRIFRSSIDALETVEALKEKGAHLVLLDMGTQSVMRDGPSKLFFSMLAAFAEFERGRIVERITSGKLLKKKKGGHIGGEAPYGWRIEGSGQAAVLVEEPAEQDVIKLVQARVKKGMTPWAIAREFRDMGIKTRSGRDFDHTQIKRVEARAGK